MARFARRDGMIPVGRSAQPRGFGLHRPFGRLIDHGFDHGFADDEHLPPPDWHLGGRERFEPHVDLHETNAQYLVVVEVPGMSDADVIVELDDDLVVVRGEKQHEECGDKDGRAWRECAYGRFERAIPLPGAIVADEAEGTVRHGVLRLRLPKAQPDRSRRRRLTLRRDDP